ncbi:MAG: HAD hydrolase family protein [Planctomycetia bacterium]|nr:HAD hydrolase family protein [Planctomycetia bacterium]
MSLTELCRPISLILSDVDGVFTDGGVIYDNQGIESKRFHIRDGLGVKLWRRAGGRFGVITGRTSHIVNVRAAELGIDIVRQGTEDKLPAARDIIAQLGLTPEQVCYIGDDLPDLPAMRCVALGVTVADGAEELRQAADYVTSAKGGEGAVRETIEMILKSQRRWEELVRKYE